MTATPPRVERRARSTPETMAEGSPSPLRTTPDVRGVVTEVVLALLVFLLLDALVFRSGLYAYILAPDSYAGQVERIISTEAGRPAGPDDVLLLGDSRMSEGFSTKLADEAGGQTGLHFMNASVPGSTLRTQYYLLRELDPAAHRYAAVIVPLDDYDDRASWEVLADRSLDLAFLAPLLRVQDATDFPWTFDDAVDRSTALADILLKGYAYRLDLQDLLTDPIKRARDVVAYHLKGEAALYDYAGHPGSLAGLRLDDTGHYVIPAGVSPEVQAELDQVLQVNAAQPSSSTAYREAWLGRIVSTYAGSSTRVIIIQMPRGPLPPPKRHEPDLDTIAWLKSMPSVEVLPASTFASLEQPGLFFDALHVNADGRAQFTHILSGILGQQQVSPSASSPPSAVTQPPNGAWTETSADTWTLDLEAASRDESEARGLYAPAGGLTFVEQTFVIGLPSSHPNGTVELRGYLPPEFDRLVPVTITIDDQTAGPRIMTLTTAGPFVLDVPVEASTSGRELVFHVDKGLVPRDVQLNQDVRVLSVGLLGVDYLLSPEAAS